MLVLAMTAVGTGVARADDPAKGAQVYAKHCASCHGTSGTPVMPSAPNFAMGESLLQADVDLFNEIKNGVNAMPAFIGILTDADIMNVVVYLRTLH
jgi:cytochrome c6